jgi:protein SCO1
MKSPKTLIITIAIAALLFIVLLVRVSQIDTDSPADTARIDDDTAIERAEHAQRVPTGEDYLSVPVDTETVRDFTLTNAATGEDFTLSAPDRITVLYYGFTACPDVCPTTLHDLRVALERLGNPPASEIQVVMVTVDPARDTPEQLQQYMERFSTDFVGLTGDEAALQAAYDAFGATFERVELPASAMEYTIDHTADVFMIAPGMAEVRRFYHSATSSNFAHDLQMLRDAYALELQANGVIPAADTPAPDFTLQSTAGGAFTLSEQARVTVLYYGFTACPDVCPTTLHELNRALDTLPNRERVQVAMITVDPERDTSTVLATYMERFHEDFIGLYGARPAVEAAQDAFGVFAFKREFPDSAMTYTYDHTADLFVVGPGGAYRLRIPYGTPRSEIAADLALLLGG